jgi:hypothetical protein
MKKLVAAFRHGSPSSGIHPPSKPRQHLRPTR